MGKVIRLTENDLKHIIESTVTQVLNESGIGLIGARNAALSNLRKRIALGVKTRRLPNGRVEDQQKRYDDREESMKADINKKFIEEFGSDGLVLPCSAWYFGNPIYGFHFTVKGIEQINTHNFSFIGDMVVDNIDAVPETLRSAVIPREGEGVILVYTFAKREMKFTRRKTGLTLTPHSDGTSGWAKLLKFVGQYNDGYTMIAR